jgi:hypothetical protein
MYVADSMGYLGSVSVLLVKELGHPNISWGHFFKEGVMIVALVGGICGVLSLIYFLQSAKLSQNSKVKSQNEQANLTWVMTNLISGINELMNH